MDTRPPRSRPDVPLTERVGAFFRSTSLPGVVAAYVFGGHAEGRAHRDSDVDVAVLLDRAVHPSPGERFELRVSLTAELIAALHSNAVDLVILNDVPPGLGRHVVTRGVRVYRSDAAAEQAFARNVQLRAAELAPFLRRMRRIKLERLLR